MGKLLFLVVAFVAVLAVAALALQGSFSNGRPGREPIPAPAGAVAWFETDVVFQRSGDTWVATIEQTDVEGIDTYVPHASEPLEDNMQDFGGAAVVGTWTLGGAIKTTDQNNGAEIISLMSAAGLSFRHGSSNVAGEIIVHAGPTFFMSHTHYRTTVSVSFSFDNGIEADADFDTVSMFIEGSS